MDGFERPPCNWWWRSMPPWPSSRWTSPTSELAPRLAELREQREAIASAAQAALGGTLNDAQRPGRHVHPGQTGGGAAGTRRGQRLSAPKFRPGRASRPRPRALRRRLLRSARRRENRSGVAPLGDDRDLTTGLERHRGKLGNGVDLERGPDAQHQIGVGDASSWARASASHRQVLAEQHDIRLQGRGAVTTGNAARVGALTGARTSASG